MSDPRLDKAVALAEKLGLRATIYALTMPKMGHGCPRECGIPEEAECPFPERWPEEQSEADALKQHYAELDYCNGGDNDLPCWALVALRAACAGERFYVEPEDGGRREEFGERG